MIWFALILVLVNGEPGWVNLGPAPNYMSCIQLVIDAEDDWDVQDWQCDRFPPRG